MILLYVIIIEYIIYVIIFYYIIIKLLYQDIMNAN